MPSASKDCCLDNHRPANSFRNLFQESLRITVPDVSLVLTELLLQVIKLHIFLDLNDLIDSKNFPCNLEFSSKRGVTFRILRSIKRTFQASASAFAQRAPLASTENYGSKNRGAAFVPLGLNNSIFFFYVSFSFSLSKRNFPENNFTTELRTSFFII